MLIPLLSSMDSSHELYEDFCMAARAICDVIDDECDLSRLLESLED